MPGLLAAGDEALRTFVRRDLLGEPAVLLEPLWTRELSVKELDSRLWVGLAVCQGIKRFFASSAA